MTAQFTASIAEQNFELIRDQIGLVLGTEFANQYVLNNAYPNINKIWIERFIVFNSETEVPAINVTVARGDYSGQTAKKADGTYMYNVDVYTSAPTTDLNGPGDQYAMVTMNKIIGMARAILSNPIYRTLGLEPGIITNVKVERFFVGDKSSVTDALSNVVGRLQFMVKAVESEALYGIAVPLNEICTHAVLKQDVAGFYYDFTLNN